MKRRAAPSATSTDLDISPLIDVVFLLLIFFMVTATFTKDAQLELERPAAQSAVKADARSLRVFLDRRGQTTIDDLPVQPWMVQSRVRDLLRASPEATVLVVVDRRVPAEKLLDVVDQCRLAGARDVGVAAENEAG
jgi:biopolymer transport protein ExbD